MITVRRERPGFTSAFFPLSSSRSWSPQIPHLCWPSQAAADSVCPLQPGCWLWFWVRKTILLPPEWVLPVLTQTLCSNNHSNPTLGQPGWGGGCGVGCPSSSTPAHTSGQLLELLPSQFITAAHSETCRTQAGFIQAELAAVPSSWQGGKLQQDKREGHNPAMAD